MEKEKQIEEIKTILRNNNHNWYLYIENDNIQCEITNEIFLEILIKIQKELLNYNIIISGNYSCGISLWFERK